MQKRDQSRFCIFCNPIGNRSSLLQIPLIGDGFQACLPPTFARKSIPKTGMKKWLLFFWLVGSQLVSAQNTDSLWTEFQRPTHDSIGRITSLHRMVRQLISHNPDSALKLAYLEEDFARSMGDSSWIAYALNMQGGALSVRNDFAAAMDRFYTMLDIRLSMRDTSGIAAAYNNIGNIYYYKGDYPRALDYYIRSLHFEELQPTGTGLAASYLNIGSIYALQQQYLPSLEYFKRALALYQELKHDSGIASCYVNMGNSYKSLDSFALAKEYFLRSITLMESTQNQYGLATTYANLATVYQRLGQHDQMFAAFHQCEQIRMALDDRLGMANLWIRRGTSYALLDQFTHARDECEKGLHIADSLDALAEMKDACDCLYLAYKGLHQDDRALSYYERHNSLRDSLAQDETLMQLQVMEFRAQVARDSLSRTAEKMAMQQDLQEGKRLRNVYMVIGIALIFLSLLLYFLFKRTRASRSVIEQEKNKADELLLNILPAEISEALMRSGKVEAQHFDQVTILFTDIVGFTKASEQMQPQELMDELNLIYSHFDEIVARHGIEKIKSIGDAYMAAGGLLLSAETSVRSTVLAGLDMQAYMLKRSQERRAAGLRVFEMRVGIHTGPVVAGIIGVKKFQYDVWGDTVNTANRMETNGAPGRVNISEETYKIIQDDPEFEIERRTKVVVKGKGEMQMYFVQRGNPAVAQELEEEVLLQQP
jgi:adenylate cyclase